MYYISMNTPIINIKILEIHLKTNINEDNDISSLIKGGDKENTENVQNEDSLLKVWKNNPSEFSEFIFSLDMLHAGKNNSFKTVGLQKYPFITDTLKYPYDDLKSKRYQYILEFFFNRGKFSKELKRELYSSKTIQSELAELKGKTKEEQNNYKQAILESNVMTMLRLLFPTSYPIMNNIRDSYSILMNKSESLEYISKFSYIKLNNKIHTITNVVWLNDLMNNPIYNQLIIEVFKYITWGFNQREVIDEEDRINLEKNEKLLKSFDAEPIIGKIDNAIADYESRGNNYYATEIRAHKTLKMALETKNDLDMTVIIQKHIYKVPRVIDDKKYWILAERSSGAFFNDFVSITPFYAANTEAISIESINWGKTDVIITLDNRNKAGAKNKELIKSIINRINNGTSATHFRGKITKSNNGFIFTLNESENVEEFEKQLQPFKNEGITIKSKNSIELEKSIFRKRIIMENDENIEKDKNDKIFYKISSILEAHNAIDRRFSEPLYTEWIRSIDRYYQSMIYINRFKEEYLKCYDPKMSSAECIRLFVGDKTDWEKTQFKEIMKTINGFKNYMSKTLKSQNSKLQNLIDNFGNNIDDNGLFNQLVVRVYQTYIENSNIYLQMKEKLDINEYLNTSISSMNFGDVGKPNYLMYLQLDLVEGEIDNTNIDKMKCMYGDKDLQKRLLDDVLNYFNKQPWELKSLPFFSIANIQEPVNNESKDIPRQNDIEGQPQPQPLPVGGRYKTIKIKKSKRRYKRNTRRKR